MSKQAATQARLAEIRSDLTALEALAADTDVNIDAARYIRDVAWLLGRVAVLETQRDGFEGALGAEEAHHEQTKRQCDQLSAPVCAACDGHGTVKCAECCGFGRHHFTAGDFNTTSDTVDTQTRLAEIYAVLQPGGYARVEWWQKQAQFLLDHIAALEKDNAQYARGLQRFGETSVTDEKLIDELRKQCKQLTSALARALHLASRLAFTRNPSAELEAEFYELKDMLRAVTIEAP